MKIRSAFPVLIVAGGLAFGMAACEAEDGGGTSPGLEAPAEDGAGTDPLAPATTEDAGLGEG
ncbi:MAG: hypothetical protein KY461_01060 [Actinobacteria bacterium]|nr:hypothetical protein [Actinomycetota bacterium]